MAEDTKRTVVEEIEVGGSQLVEQVKSLIHEGNIRQLKIIAQDGETQLEVPLTIGVLAGGAVALAAPWLAVIGVIAALVKRVKIEIEREEAEAPALPEPEKAEG